jgi:hypothetical protein
MDRKRARERARPYFTAANPFITPFFTSQIASAGDADEALIAASAEDEAKKRVWNLTKKLNEFTAAARVARVLMWIRMDFFLG